MLNQIYTEAFQVLIVIIKQTRKIIVFSKCIKTRVYLILNTGLSTSFGCDIEKVIAVGIYHLNKHHALKDTNDRIHFRQVLELWHQVVLHPERLSCNDQKNKQFHIIRK
jgi:hypothetical protein